MKSSCTLEHPYQSGCHDAGKPLRPGGDELTRHALLCAGFRAGERVLDLGCGVGVATQQLHDLGCCALGLDLAVSRLALARRTMPELAMVAGDAHRLPFADGSLDGVLAECALSLIGYTTAALGECRRVLRPGGRIAVTDLFARADGASPSPLPGCLGGMMCREAILTAFAEAGFVVQRWEDHSDRLRTFVAQLIFSGQGAEALWNSDGPANAEALRARHPGYFLLVATRDERTH
jgi:ubiquinone/menaquinone biosynthesis C-methylase UbiE